MTQPEMIDALQKALDEVPDLSVLCASLKRIKGSIDVLKSQLDVNEDDNIEKWSKAFDARSSVSKTARYLACLSRAKNELLSAIECLQEISA